MSKPMIVTLPFVALLLDYWPPLHVESVARIAERKDVLGALFWFLTLLAYVRYTERPTTARYAFVLFGWSAKTKATKTGLVTLDKLNQAAGEFRIAVRLKPDYARAHFNLGSALANMGRLDEAIREFSEVLRIDPSSRAARESLEYCQELQGKR
jgi:tetratricopeptide (TPR) repeat protein